MQPKDKICKATWSLFEGARDLTMNNVTLAVKGGMIHMDAHVVQTILAVIRASFEEGYHKGSNAYMREVDSVLKSATEQVSSAIPLKKK